MSADENRILIAGAGIAGLTAALAFAQRGFGVSVYESAEILEEIGAGLQLSPNATHILARLNVLDGLMPHTVQPEAVVLRRASTLAEIARVPLGKAAEQRWGAPYLVCHRADLQRALLAAVARQPNIELTTGATVQDFAIDPPRLTIELQKTRQEIDGKLIVAADGVWSTLRSFGGKRGESRFIGQVAWRRTVTTADPSAKALFDALPGQEVSAFLHPGFHLIAYPVRGGQAINIVAFTPSRQEFTADWSQQTDLAPLRQALAATSPVLAGLAAEPDGWTAWPIHVADLDAPWSAPGGLALIGDAAHAMTPFAAQGAAMAIEDAETLAAAVASQPDDLAGSLKDWTIARRRRVLRVARRGALNQFAWHARGPIATARNVFLKLRGPERLAADMDWLYGWKQA